jgi:acetyl esterase/lipase
MRRPIRRWCGGLALALGLLGVVPASAQQEKTRGPGLPEGVKVERDLEYARAGDVALRLDLYLPEKDEGAGPLVVWVHGGAWQAGSKDNCPIVPMVARGYAVASIGYRLTDVAPFPAQIADCRAAIRWLRAHAEKYHLDKDRVGAWGASAGGHLVALLGMAADAPDWDKVGGHPDQSSRVQAVCDYFGPADFTAMPESSRALGADSAVGKLLGGALSEKKEEARRASPVLYASKDDPPFLIVHGDEDRTVALDQSKRLEKALKNAGADVQLLVVKGGGHGFRGETEPSPTEVRDTVFSFFDRNLKGGGKSQEGR